MADKTLEEIKSDILHRAGRINPFERVKKPMLSRSSRTSRVSITIYGAGSGVSTAPGTKRSVTNKKS